MAERGQERVIDAPEALEPELDDTEAYERALEAYLDHVPRRDLVPSDRELATGTAEYEFRAPPPMPTPPKRRVLRRFVDDVKMLNPRSIATRETYRPLLVLTALATAAPFGDITFYVVLFAYIQPEFGVGLGFLLALRTLMDLTTALSGPLIGFLADRVSRVRLIRIGTLIDGFCVLVTALAPNVLTIAISRIVGSTGLAVSTPAVAPITADYFPVEKRARVYGFQAMAGTLWNILSIGIVVQGLFLLQVFTWRQVMLAAGCITILCGVFAFFMRDPVRGEADRRSLGASEAVAKTAQPPATWDEAWRTCRSIGTLRKLWYATPFLYVAQIGTSYVLAFAIQQKINEAQTGGPSFGSGFFADPTVARIFPVLMLIGPQLMQVVLIPIAFAIADRLLRDHPGRIMVYFGLVMGALGLISVGAMFAPNPLAVIPLSLLVGALASLIAPAQGLLLAVVIPPRVRGQGFQTVQPFKVVGIIMLAALGPVIAAIGAEATVFYVLLPTLVVAATILVQSGSEVGRDIRNAVAASLATEESTRARAEGRSKMIVMRNVDVAYGGAQVLFDVDFDVEDGELVAVLGTNGAGKSTLLKAISGIHEATGGAVFLDGQDITHKPAHLNARDGIVFLPGGRAIFPTLTVSENLRAAAWLYDKDEEYVSTRTHEVLDFFPVLRERLEQKAGDLSGGEQQMLALGQALLMRPRLLMIDELSLGLAPRIVEQLLEIVRQIHAQGTTVLLVEQSVNVALTLAERAVFLDKGRIQFDGPTEELLSRGDLLRAVFLGHAGGGGLARTGRPRRKTSDAAEQVLVVEGARVSYGGVLALHDVDLHVDAGEVVGIIGPNGAGKTTLFDVIAGSTRPDAGRIVVAGTEVTDLPPDARALLGLARSFQDTRLFPSLTVRETIAVALQRHTGSRNPVLAAAWVPSVRKAEKRAFRRVEYLVELLGLEAYADKFLDELSTGTRRMVDLACVMAVEPRILLLDEPSSGLAQAETEALGPVVSQLCRETGCGVLVIEHDIPLVTGMSDRMLAMELGRVIAEGRPETIASDPRVVDAYLGASDAVLNRSGSFQRAVAGLRGAP